MAKKTRITGFGRFILFLLIASPLIYLGAAYYRGEDGLANIKKAIGLDQSNERVIPTPQRDENVEATDSDCAKLETENRRLKDDIEYKNRRIEELYEEIEKLKK